MTDDKKGFSVKDRRLFSEETPADEASESAPGETPQAGADEAAPKKPPRPEQEAAAQLPEVNFSTFIFSLNSATLVHLGIIEDPASGQKTKNLPLAKQTIDILGMLERKTRGNLSSDEEAMLRSILYDLRMIYIREKG
ncbi:MAG TPA: DUF1844 domain-containing protein [Desulfobacterales bacterium]|jgi:hypothetical protein|nr:DUF1844 domain-containing protein [Desulfobacterales bacterium]